VPEPVTGTARLIEDYLGSTLTSVVKAQGLLSSQLAEFIERIGFEPPEADGEPLRARTFSFEFLRTEVGEDEQVHTRRVTATLPLLTIVSLPALAIDTADFEMDLRIIATDAPDDGGTGRARLLPGGVRPLQLWTIPGRPRPPVVAPPPGRPPRPEPPAAVGSVHISVTLRRLDLPLGLERVERLLNDGFTEEVAEEDE
jgi:hypothetical protein